MQGGGHGHRRERDEKKRNGAGQNCLLVEREQVRVLVRQLNHLVREGEVCSVQASTSQLGLGDWRGDRRVGGARVSRWEGWSVAAVRGVATDQCCHPSSR